MKEETLGGNYGEATPNDLSFNITAAIASTISPSITSSKMIDNTKVITTDTTAISEKIRFKNADESDRGKYTGKGGKEIAEVCSVDKDPWPTVYSNTLSALSAVVYTSITYYIYLYNI